MGDPVGFCASDGPKWLLRTVLHDWRLIRKTIAQQERRDRQAVRHGIERRSANEILGYPGGCSAS